MPSRRRHDPSRTHRWGGAVVCAFGLIVSSSSATTDEQSAVLHEGMTFEHPAIHGQTDHYEMTLNAGDFLDVSVSQAVVLVSPSLRGPDGRVVRAINLPDIDPLPKRLLFIATDAGRYVLDIPVHSRVQVDEEVAASSKSPEAAQPSYVLRVERLHPATAADRLRNECFNVLEQADRLAHLETMDGLRSALPLFRETADRWHRIDDAAFETATLMALAHLAGYFTQFHAQSAKARERLTELLPALGDPALEGTNWRHLAVEYQEDGRLEDARQAVTRALEIADAHGLRTGVARSHRELGFLEFELGNYERARELAQRAQQGAQALPFPALEALATWDLARLDEIAGDLDAAVAHCRRALELAQENGPESRRAQGLITMWLGFLYLRRGELDAAESHFEARLALAKISVQRDQEAFTRLGLADVRRARGDRNGARQRYQDAAAALAKGAQAWRCLAEQRLARMNLEDGNVAEAQRRFDLMLEIAMANHGPQCEAEARAGFAEVAVRLGDLDRADAEAQRAVEISEAFREAAVSLESRSSGFGALAPVYDRAIEIAMRRADRGDPGAVARAFAFNEQALARALLDRVLEGRLETTARVPPSLAAERRRIRERWRARLTQLQTAVRSHANAPEVKALVDETSALAVQVRDVDARIDAADTRHALFASPRSAGLESIQAQLDDDTVLLEYALGDARSYLWVVSRDDIRAFTLAPRRAIEQSARRVHESLAQSPVDAWGSDRTASGDDLRALARLVVEPAASFLQHKRLAVVTVGSLSLVPFAVLPEPANLVSASSAAPSYHPLLLRHEIVQLPSATLLGAMRQLIAGRAPSAKTAAVFADPIYDVNDPRVRSGSVAGSSDATARTGSMSRLALSRLPFSRGEADAISALAPGRITTFLGAEATREHALGRALLDYRFIHFATHGLVNQDVSSLSSLVLSMVDRNGRPRDGLLMLPDIYEMTLNADVVVLSGCQTALGKQVRGEGPMGLARGFMYAGAPRVVASLWQVDDLATAELMKRFYRGMLVDRLTAAAALRRAQRSMASTERWGSPYFWAGFVLQGDWR